MIASSRRGDLRWSIDARRMLPVCVVLSLGLHGLLFASGASRLAWSGPRGGSVPRSISVRLVRDERPDPTPVDGASVLSVAQATEQATPASPVPSPLAPTPVPAAVPVQAVASAAPMSAPKVANESPGNAVASPFAGSNGGDDYVPRPLLTVPPAPKAPVIIAMPPGLRKFGRQVSTLALFIDEQGAVDHIVVDGPPLPAAMEESARQAFKAAHFSPGQVNGHVVKSRIRVEVVFDQPDPSDVAHSP